MKKYDQGLQGDQSLCFTIIFSGLAQTNSSWVLCKSHLMFEVRPWSHILNVGYLCGYFSKGMSSWGPLARGIICALQCVPVVLLSNSGNRVLFLTYLCEYWNTYLVDIPLFCIRAWKLMPPTIPHPSPSQSVFEDLLTYQHHCSACLHERQCPTPPHLTFVGPSKIRLHKKYAQ